MTTHPAPQQPAPQQPASQLAPQPRQHSGEARASRSTERTVWWFTFGTILVLLVSILGLGD